MAQAIIANARNVMLVADSTKLRRSAPVRIAHFSQIQTFITDRRCRRARRTSATRRGIEVVEAMDKPAADIDDFAEAAGNASASPCVRPLDRAPAPQVVNDGT